MGKRLLPLQTASVCHSLKIMFHLLHWLHKVTPLLETYKTIPIKRYYGCLDYSFLPMETAC